jgi:hypothetical protein
MSLQEQLQKAKEERITKTPVESATVFGFIDELVRSGIAEKSLRKGSKVPDFSLPDAKGNIVKFSDLRARGPVVVTFYRGRW